MKHTLFVVSLLLGLSTPSLSAQRILHLDFLVANASDRAGEHVVWIDTHDLALLPTFDGFSFVVTTTNSPDLARDLAARRAFEVPAQAIDEDDDGRTDRVAVLVSLQAGETKVVTLQSGTPAQMVRLKGRFPNPIPASRLGGGRGMLWESENAAFVWQREGTMRPVTKLSARTLLDQIPAARLLEGGTPAWTIPAMPGDAEAIATGPVVAGARIAGPAGESTFLIGRGSRWTQVRTRIRDHNSSPRLGIPPRPGEIRRAGTGWIASWGGEPAVGLALWIPPRYLAAPDSSAAPLLLLQADADGWVEYALGAYAADEHQENIVEPGETNRRLPEVLGAERYGVASTRILLRPPRRTADAFWQELEADIQSLAQPPRVTRLSSQAATYTSLLPVEVLQPGAPKSYRSALDLMIRRVRTLTEQSEGKLWFSSDPEGKPVFKDRSWGEGYLVAMLWDGFRTSGDQWYRTAALAANQLMLGGEEREFHATGLNYWNASVRSYRETADPQWRTSGLKCADMMARIADPVTGLIPENGPAQRKKPEDPYHRSNYVKIDALVGLPILWWAYEETKERRYLDAAKRHADATMTMFIEPDGAALQMLWLKPGTTEILGVATHQGYGGNTRWARGLAWILDGFPDAYRVTKAPAYRAVFERSSRWLEANLPEDMVPWYDFDDQAVFWRYRDSSTAAICAYGLLRMSALEPNASLARHYEQFGRRIVDSLIDRYLTPVGRDDRRPPGMLAHACYTKPEEGEFIWGSYSLLRALYWLHEKDAKRAP